MLNIPAIGSLITRQWSELGGSESQPEPPVNPFTRQAQVPWAKKYPKAKNPVKLTDSQLDSILARIDLPHLGRNEALLTLSRIEEEGNLVALPAKIKEVVGALRQENIPPGPVLRSEQEWKQRQMAGMVFASQKSR